MDSVKDFIREFYPYAKKKLGFKEDISKISLLQDEENAKDLLGKTAYYDTDSKSISVYVSGRHKKDVSRSLAHEIVHHAQNCRGEFKRLSEEDYENGYALKNDHLREMEREAYEKGNMLFREWEDIKKTTNYEGTPKEDNKMKYSKEQLHEHVLEAIEKILKERNMTMKQLVEKFGKRKQERPLPNVNMQSIKEEEIPEQNVEEGCSAGRKRKDLEERMKRDIEDRMAGAPDTPQDRLKPLEEENIEELEEERYIETSDAEESLEELFQARRNAINESLMSRGWYKTRC